MSPSTLINQLENAINQAGTSEVLALDTKLDQFFGIQFEKLTQKSSDLYPELEQQALSTSYLDYYQILKLLKPNETMVDLGAGYARGTLLAHYLNLPKCTSIELAYERVESAKNALAKLGGNAAEINQGDLNQIEIPKADYYYLYFPLGRTFYKLIKELLNTQAKLIVCESHGDMLPFLTKLLGPTAKSKLFKTSLPRHNEYIYQFDLSKTKQSDSFLSFWPQHFDQDEWLVFSYEHLILKQQVKLWVSIKDLDLVQVGESFYPQNIHSGRIYNTDVEFKFESVEPRASVPTEILNLNCDPTAKIITTPKLMVEKSNGNILSF